MSPLLMESFLSLSGSIINSPALQILRRMVQDFFAEPKNKEDLDGTIRERLIIFDAFRRPDRRRNTGSLTQKALAAAKATSFTEGMQTAASAVSLVSYTSTTPPVEDALFDLASRLSLDWMTSLSN